MGLLSWIFPSDEDRIATARGLLEAGRFADARLEVMSIDSDEARALVLEAENSLCEMNLDAAISWAEAGEDRRVATHLELADQFNHGQLDDRFRETRKELREIRARRRAEVEAQKAAEEARLMQVDPFGFQGGPSHLDPPLPADLYGAEADEMRARLALLVDNYPADLRPAVGELGAPFARAVLDLDDGRPDLSLQGLLALPDEQPLVQWERARAAYALGDPVATARALRRFGELAGGHYPMGRQHSAVFLAQCMAEAGDPAGALTVLRSARADDPDVGGVLFAQLLEVNGHYEEAEENLRGLIKAHPSTTLLYKLLARVRVGAGLRVDAMAALEKAVETCNCPPGKCGYKPPDPEVFRQLAILYLEDGIETARALDLANQAAALVQQPGWEDVYLSTLVAKQEHSPDAPALVQRLWEMTPADDPRRVRMSQYLPAPA